MQEQEKEEKKCQEVPKHSATTKIRIASFVMTLYLAIIIIIVFAISSMHSDAMNNYHVYATTQLQPQQQKTDLSLSTLISQGSPLLGDPTASVTVIDFSDFQCYLCARYVKATEPLINQHISNQAKLL